MINYQNLSKKDLKDIISGIGEEWELQSQDLIYLSQNQIEFIKFFDNVSSVIVHLEDRKRFLKVDKSKFFENLTPLEFMKKETKNIEKANDIFDRMFGP